MLRNGFQQGRRILTTFIPYDELTNQRLGQLAQTERIVTGRFRNPYVMEQMKDGADDEEIRLYHPFVKEDGMPVAFEELLLDERYADGFLCVPVSRLREVGFLNERIQKKRIYELLLRLGERYPVVGYRLPDEDALYQDEPLQGRSQEHSGMEERQKEYRDDCYIVGKYSQILQCCGYFDAVVGELLHQAEELDKPQEALAWLEDMLGHGKQYNRILGGTAPVLIYYGVTYCYNILNVMLEGLKEALERLGVPVITYDEQQEDVAGLSRYMGCRFRAVIGIQSYLMSVYMKQSGRYLHDGIIGPKFNIILDHPIWLKNQLGNVGDAYYVLTHDQNYADFIRRYYPKVAGTFLFPPGGRQLLPIQRSQERCYDVVFIGTYGDYRTKCEVMRQSRRDVRFLANHFLFHMRKNTQLTAEKAFHQALEDYGIACGNAEFLGLFYEFRSVIQCVMYYYREKVIRTLLEHGIAVDVWGSSWKNAPFADHPCLTIHEDVTPEVSLQILAKAKLSLNIMAWHKGGFTERMANTMLQGAVLVTDQTSYREYGFTPGSDCVMFSLEELKELPQQIKKLLADKEKRAAVAQAGQQYARTYQTWDSRAEQLLQIIEEL